MKRFKVELYMYVDAEDVMEAEGIVEDILRQSDIYNAIGMDSIVICEGSTTVATPKTGARMSPKRQLSMEEALLERMNVRLDELETSSASKRADSVQVERINGRVVITIKDN